jgi:hypothetical protein
MPLQLSTTLACRFPTVMLRLPGEQEKRRQRKRLKEVDILQHAANGARPARRGAALKCRFS